MYRHVFILSGALDTIRQEVRRTPFLKETGGPMVGYVSTDEAVVVTHAAGPGPLGKRGYFSVLIDGRYATQFCNRAGQEFNGCFYYVGDWHCHRGWSLKPSHDDLKAMRVMAAYVGCPMKRPISLIYRYYPEEYRAYTLNSAGRLEPTPVSELAEVPYILHSRKLLK